MVPDVTLRLPAVKVTVIALATLWERFAKRQAGRGLRRSISCSVPVLHCAKP
jgi:hypothetical protein